MNFFLLIYVFVQLIIFNVYVFLLLNLTALSKLPIIG